MGEVLYTSLRHEAAVSPNNARETVSAEVLAQQNKMKGNENQRRKNESLWLAQTVYHVSEGLKTNFLMQFR